MDYNLLCSQVCKSHKDIAGTWLFAGRHLIASFVKPKIPVPNREEQEKMFVQATIMLSIAKTNVKMYGKTKFVMVSFEKFNAFFFPMGGNKILSVGCSKDVSVDELVATLKTTVLVTTS